MDSETALMTAVRDQLRKSLQYTKEQCDLEIDEFPPAGAGDFYVAVMPGSVTPGPRNDTCGGILDEVVSIAVAVIQRAPRVPKDRTRTLMFDALSGINIRHRQIMAAFGQFNYVVLNAANLLLGNAEGFIEPLRFKGMENRPRVVGGEYFSASNTEQRAGLARVAYYGGARRIQHIAGGLT